MKMSIINDICLVFGLGMLLIIFFKLKSIEQDLFNIRARL